MAASEMVYVSACVLVWLWAVWWGLKSNLVPMQAMQLLTSFAAAMIVPLPFQKQSP